MGQSTTGKTVQLEYPNKIAEKISVDYKERILINFNVLDSLTKKAMLIHQAFIKLTHLETGAEIIYVAGCQYEALHVRLGPGHCHTRLQLQVRSLLCVHHSGGCC